jgi:hypothetical protein
VDVSVPSLEEHPQLLAGHQNISIYTHIEVPALLLSTGVEPPILSTGFEPPIDA